MIGTHFRGFPRSAALPMVFRALNFEGRVLETQYF
jgi:hypothetical protein